MGIKYSLSENDLIKIKENYGKIPNKDLLKLLDNDCSVGILTHTAKKLGVRTKRDVVIRVQLSETYDKIIEILNIIEDKKADSLEHATQLGGLHISTFLKSIKKYPKLLERYNKIKWNDVFDLKCSVCNSLLTLDNYRRLNNITSSKGANKNRFRKCDTCHNLSNRVIDTPAKKIGLIFSSAKTRAKMKNMDFTITKNDIIKMANDQNSKCYYTGDTMEYEIGNPKMISIDRLDSSKGYTLDNICLTTWEINKMKAEINFGRFLGICRKINSNFKSD
jgi:hypothetical protein